MSLIHCIWSLLILPNVFVSTEWTLVKQEACFSATSLVTTYTFNPPRSGNVDAVKLVHTSGEITCDTAYGYTNWGCITSWVNAFLVYLVRHNNDESLDLVLPTLNTQDVTNSWGMSQEDQIRCANTCYQWAYKMNGDGVSESELIWSDSALNLYVETTDIFSIQYSEGCCGATQWDNDGISCAAVYFQYEPTPSPTIRPSLPTSVPSSVPTESPTTSYPTDAPSLNPSTSHPIADPTADPTAKPTAHPSEIPTVEPTTDPSTYPTTTPTAEPTTDPTPAPSQSPTMSPVSCGSVFIVINNFDVLSSDIIKTHPSLQESMSNITYFSIAENTGVLGISREQFYVQFQNVSEPLYMVHTLCAFVDSALNILLTFISSHDYGISASMEKRLAAQYNIEDNNTLDVIIASEAIDVELRELTL